MLLLQINNPHSRFSRLFPKNDPALPSASRKATQIKKAMQEKAENPRAAKKNMKNIKITFFRLRSDVMYENTRPRRSSLAGINKIIRMASVGAALAVVFTIAFATPAFAHASSYYGSYGGGNYNGGNYNNHNYSTQSYYASNSGYNYSYNYSQPVTYPVYYPVYYQQPVVVQQPQPVPVYTPVYTPVYQQPIPQPQPVPVYTPVPTPVYQTYTNGGNLVAACFADRTTATVGTPVTWSVEVTGGTGQYAYSWSGSGGLAGTGASAIQSYGTTGQKNATVLINSNGQTISQACGDSVNVHAYVAQATTYRAPTPVVNSTSNQNQNNPNSISANALFSLGNVPWGWVAILIIIILGVTVFYLIFNRNNKEV